MNRTTIVIVLANLLALTLMAPAECWSQVSHDQMLNAFREYQDENELIEEALSEICSFEIFEKPLFEVRSFLSKHFGIPIVLDKEGLDLAGFSTDEQVTANIKSVTLRAALDRIMAEFDGTIIIRDGTLFITSREAASDQLTCKLYDVSQLLSTQSRFDRNVRAASNPSDRIEIFMEKIKELIAPGSWESAGGTAEIKHFLLGRNTAVLSVLQTEAAHWRLKLLLGSLVSATKKGGSSSHSSADEINSFKSDNDILTCVYPINKDATPADAIELIETVLSKEEVGREKKTFLMKKIGNTIVVRNSRRTHDAIHELLNASQMLAQPQAQKSEPQLQGGMF